MTLRGCCGRRRVIFREEPRKFRAATRQGFQVDNLLGFLLEEPQEVSCLGIQVGKVPKILEFQAVNHPLQGHQW